MFATKQFRQVANPGDKTDDHDLSTLHRAAVNGFALAEPERDEFWTSFLRIARFRRGLIHAAAKLRCQIRNHLDAYLPGLCDSFHDFWKNHCAWPIARHFLSPQAIRAAGEDGLADFLHAQNIRFHRRSLPPVLAWAQQAPRPDEAALTQLPPTAYDAEAAPLRDRLETLKRGRARDPQGLAELLPKVLARLGGTPVQSRESGAPDPR